MQYLSSFVLQLRRDFAKVQGMHVGWLIGLFIGAEFVLTLPILGFIADGVSRAITANPALTAGAKPYIIAFSVAFTSTVNVFIISLTAVPLLLVTLIFGSTSSYRAIFSMLLWASTPILLGHALRNLSYGLGWKHDLTSGVLPLKQVLPAFDASLAQQLAQAFDVFDVWTMALVVIGYMAVSGMRRVPAAAAALLIWGMLQLLLFRLYLSGAAA